jgi:hypothetical protein
MRAHHVIFVVAALLIGFGVKERFFATKVAEAGVQSGSSVNVLQMHIDHPRETLPTEHIRDMTFVFDSER